MKRNFLMTVASMLVAVGAYAGTPGTTAKVAVVQQGATLKLYYKGTTPCSVRVSIAGENGDVIYAETIKDVEGFVRPYNVSDVDNGEYTVTVTDKNTTYTEKVRIGQKRDEAIAGLIRVSGERGKYILRVPAGEPKDLSVTIFADNREIYRESLAINSDFAKVYNLNSVKGSLAFEISDNQGHSTVINY